jgi:hypothetical protein
MNLQERKDLLIALGRYMAAAEEDWQMARQKASAENAWFLPEFIDRAVTNIVQQFLQPGALQELTERYSLGEPVSIKKVGIVMAGNIPLVGFHDLLCTFLAGHRAFIKLSSKDNVLIDFLVKKLIEFNPSAEAYLQIGDMLKGCDAYIATGSNNSSAYFDYYFAKYPHVIRKARTSIAVLSGNESDEELAALADDVYLFFGLGCRNVTKIFVPRDFPFERLLNVFKKYNYLADFAKYKNNYDYNQAILLLNNRPYMSNESLLLVEDSSVFSPISQLNYEFFDNVATVAQALAGQENIQCMVGRGYMPFGKAQQPGVCDYADGVDTMAFLCGLTEVRRS